MPNPHNEEYLRAKRDRLGHVLHHQGLPLDDELLHAEQERDGAERASEAEAPERAGDGSLRVCVATFYDDLADRLVAGATAALVEGGVDARLDRGPRGPGRLRAAARGQVVRADRALRRRRLPRRRDPRRDRPLRLRLRRGRARASRRCSSTTGVPCAFGVITCDTREQAEARAGGDKRDQGRNAALAALRMAELRSRLRSPRAPD